MLSGTKLRTACMYTEQCQHYDTHAVCSEVGFVHQEYENIFLFLFLVGPRGGRVGVRVQRGLEPGAGARARGPLRHGPRAPRVRARQDREPRGGRGHARRPRHRPLRPRALHLLHSQTLLQGQECGGQVTQRFNVFFFREQIGFWFLCLGPSCF